MKLDRYYEQPIELTAAHRKLAARLAIGWQDEMEWGGPEVDAKRPFGNSDMPGDVAEILGWDHTDGELTTEQIAEAKRLHFEMGYVLRAALFDWLQSHRVN